MVLNHFLDNFHWQLKRGVLEILATSNTCFYFKPGERRLCNLWGKKRTHHMDRNQLL